MKDKVGWMPQPGHHLAYEHDAQDTNENGESNVEENFVKRACGKLLQHIDAQALGAQLLRSTGSYVIMSASASTVT